MLQLFQEDGKFNGFCTEFLNKKQAVFQTWISFLQSGVLFSKSGSCFLNLCFFYAGRYCAYMPLGKDHVFRAQNSESLSTSQSTCGDGLKIFLLLMV